MVAAGRVFLSYSVADAPAAEQICQALERAGVSCWIAPRDIPPGADWAEAIVDAIDSSMAMLLVYSEASNQSVQVRREVERAVSRRLRLVPVRISDVPMSKAMAYFLS